MANQCEQWAWLFHKHPRLVERIKPSDGNGWFDLRHEKTFYLSCHAVNEQFMHSQ